MAKVVQGQYRAGNVHRGRRNCARRTSPTPCPMISTAAIQRPIQRSGCWRITTRGNGAMRCLSCSIRTGSPRHHAAPPTTGIRPGRRAIPLAEVNARNQSGQMEIRLHSPTDRRLRAKRTRRRGSRAVFRMGREQRRWHLTVSTHIAPAGRMPIHDLLVANHVTAVFHGHDHLFVKQDLDGIIYQEVPQPSAARANATNSAAEYGYVIWRCAGQSRPYPCDGHARTGDDRVCPYVFAAG